MFHIRDCTVEDTLHSGAETVVYRVTHNLSGECLVAKTIAPSASNQRGIGRLIHEYGLLVKLADVTGVVRTRGLEHDGADVTLWLEDQQLRSLDRVLRERTRLPLTAALRIALELSRVLSRVHAKGVVHKDIKPQNILWDEANGGITLLDFTIASELPEEATTANVPEALEGTLAYMSPEQTGRTARGLDVRTDFYSLGAVLFELLTGRPPFVEADPLKLVHSHLAKPVPSLESFTPGLPATVARIVYKCLEKTPEKRYQTARGLAVDVEECVRQLDECGSIDETLSLGLKDFSPTLHLPQALVSRETEAAEIKGAFDRAAGGAVEVLLLGGPSGVGKTALVRSVYQEIARASRGLLLSGKHDQLGRSIPYAALAQAFGGLMRNLAGSPKSVFDAWRDRIDQALGPLSRVIADIVPELEWLMGNLPPVPIVPTEMTHNRIKMSWIQLVRVVSDMSPPLVLFLDDMQWADQASIELLKTILTDIAKKNLLVILAYRDNEVDAGHPLWGLVHALEKANVSTPRLKVGPLNIAAVQTWLAVALSSDTSQVAPLAKILQNRTQGNPFFLGQLLLALHQQKRVRRNLDTGEWEWDQAAVEQAGITDNVIELMRQKVAELPANTQAILGQTACAGHSFSLSEVAVFAGIEPSTVVRDLQPALLAGLVVPQNGHYREAQALAQSAAATDMDVGYRFLHDRVQQAFYERMEPEKRARTHLLVGRRLQRGFEEGRQTNQKLLEFVRHLNLGAGALFSEWERRDLAALNLRAARAAKANGSYGLQAALVEQAYALLGPNAAQSDFTLFVLLVLEHIEADFMLREFAGVHRRAQELLLLPVSQGARLAAYELRVKACVASGQYGDGKQVGLRALAELGITFPESGDACMTLAVQGIRECDTWLDEHPHGFSLMDADPDVEHLLCDAVSAALLMTCASTGSAGLAALVTAWSVKRAIERKALTTVTPFFISAMANARSTLFAQYRSDVRWAREGEQIANRLGSPYFPECAVMLGYYLPYELPVKESHAHYQAALRIATASGSFQGIGWVLLAELCYQNLWPGLPLQGVATMEREGRDVIARAGDAHGTHHFDLVASYAAFLCSTQNARPSLDQDWLPFGSRFFASSGANTLAERARILEAHLLLAFGHSTRALHHADEAERFSAIAYGAPPVTDIALWRGLAAAKCWSPSLGQEEQAALLHRLDRAIERFKYFSQGCANNFLHKLCLLEAERGRIEGRAEIAINKYDEAIGLAHKESFLHIEALAAQFCAEYHLEGGRERSGMLYLREARDAYARWDARALVAHLEHKYPHLMRAPTAMALGAMATTTDTGNTAVLDVHTAIRAAQALSSELDPNHVVGRLMDLCLTNAGAQLGALLFVENDALVLVARLSVQGAHVETGLSVPLGQTRGVATTVVNYVARSRQPVVVDDMSTEKRFTQDPHLLTHSVRSLLALPLIHRGRLGGVLYLEHRDSPSAFSPSRVELLSVIASHAAIAVENANLYRNVEAQLRALETRNREVQQLNDELRRQIAQRSRRLMESLLPADSMSDSPNRLEVGGMLGDCYRVLRLLGQGGMGAVYEVERTTDSLHLAAKVLNHSPDRTDLGRFTREAQILAKLSHPYLISIFDVDVTDDGTLFIVMEFVAGKNLQQIGIRSDNVQWILCLLAQVASALEALHAQAIVHRDLKPENILVIWPSPDAAPVVKLADFGISIILDDPQAHSPKDAFAETLSVESPLRVERSDKGPMLTETGVIVGTPFYMAPELVNGSKNAQQPSDLFSFGVIAYELLVGSRPFSMPPIFLGLSAPSDFTPVGLQHCTGVPTNLVAIFERCLDLEPQNRPLAGEVAKELEEYLQPW